MIKITKSSWKFFDWTLILTVFLIFVMGALSIANASGGTTVEPGESWLQVLSKMNTYYLTRHIFWFFSGLAIAVLVMFIDYEFLGDIWMIIYWANIGMLLLLFVLGDTTFGATNWLKIDINQIEQTFQPSEIAKLALIISLAKRLSRFPDGIQTLRDLLITLLYVGIPFAIILAQNDLGTGMVYIFITLVMIFVSGCNWKLLLGLGGVGGAMIYPAWLLLGEIQKNRIRVFLDPSIDPSGVGYNVRMATTAVGSGGMTGMGFFNPSSLTQLNFLTVKLSDFIFASAAETFGFFIMAGVILLYAYLIIRLVILSRRSFDRFGSYLIIGIAAMMAFHIIENIGMNLGVMPVTGIPLPFYSNGGSNMWTNMIAIGIVYSVIMRRERGLFHDPEVL